MKKTLTINLGGIVYHIDDDAYRLLDNYLSNLKHYFRKQDEHLQVLHHLRLSAEVTERKRPKHVLVLSLVFRHPGIPYIKIIFHIHVH